MKKKHIWYLTIFLGLIFLSPVLYQSFEYIIYGNPMSYGLTELDYSSVLERRWHNKPTNFLVQKLKNQRMAYFDAAFYLLEKRGADSGIVQDVKKILDANIKNNNLNRAGDLLYLVFILDKDYGEKTSVEILKTIPATDVLSVRDSALAQLAKNKCNSAYRLFIELAHSSKRFKEQAPFLFKNLDDSRAIPVLQELGSDPGATDSYKEEVAKVIAYLQTHA